ncbi:unnamed protein product [Menidia menidia]|uniref:(Atlantic silverside) hypothetical protein n=1 Tax=Menidia menidia TaxID=238744 RepID=A0A8S4BEU4_9TELE|nr:unnamed protein product [Menidia menidia]
MPTRQVDPVIAVVEWSLHPAVQQLQMRHLCLNQSRGKSSFEWRPGGSEEGAAESGQWVQWWRTDEERDHNQPNNPEEALRSGRRNGNGARAAWGGGGVSSSDITEEEYVPDSEDSESDSINDSPVETKGKIPWTQQEKMAVQQFMTSFVAMRKVPGKNECIMCIEKSSPALQRRTWKDLFSLALLLEMAA